MDKQETLTFYYTRCGECPNAGDNPEYSFCLKKASKKITDLWGEIPEFCPLEDSPKTETQIEGE